MVANLENSIFVNDEAFNKYGFENPNNSSNAYKVLLLEKLVFSDSEQILLGYKVYNNGTVEDIQWNALTGKELGHGHKNRGISLEFSLPNWVRELIERGGKINVLIRDADDIYEVSNFNPVTRWFCNSKGHSVCLYHPTTELMLPDELSDLHNNTTKIWVTE